MFRIHSFQYLAGLLIAATFASHSVYSSELSETQRLTSDSHNALAKSQQIIDKISGKTQQVVGDYLFNERQADITEAYNAQLSKLISSQVKEIADLNNQIDSIEETERAMLPMLNVMVDELNSFVKTDTPFLIEERLGRLEKLLELIDRADVSVAEKYRQILEAYLVEVGYGRTIEAYSGELIDDKQGTHVNYLRMGRVALYFQSLNGQEGGIWLPAHKRWESLDSGQNMTLTKAIQIAQQQRVPELLPLPVAN